MKNKATSFLKQIFSAVVTMVKAKSMAVRSKTNALKTRLLIFSLLQNKKVLMKTINHKIHALIKHAEHHNEEDTSKAIVPYNAETALAQLDSLPCIEDDCNGDEDDQYPDLTHSLFDLDDDDEDLGDVNGSVIDLVRNSKEDGEEFSLENEIDHVADVFIKRFHRQIKLQKMDSFKRFKEMMERSVA